jgi:hypothetical protein
MTQAPHMPPEPAPKSVGPPAIEVAARDVYHALVTIGPHRLTHAPGCPAEYLGPCTCGTEHLVRAMQALSAAIAGLSAPI